MKLLTVALLLVAVILVGCGGEKSSEQPAPAEPKIEQLAPELVNAVLVAGSFWTNESNNMSLLADAFTRNDMEYLNQLLLEKKVFRVDNNTKVMKFDTPTSDGSVLIQFKEGRYTNKEGYTFVYNVFTETEFPTAYLANQEQSSLQLVNSALATTETYFDLIKTEDVESLNQMLNLCNVLEKTLLKKSEDTQIDSSMRNCIKDVRKIILTRGAAVLGSLKIVKYKQDKNDYQHKLAVETTYSFCKDELRLRHIFKSNYGF